MKVTVIGRAHRVLATIVALILLSSLGTARSVQAQDVAQATQSAPLDSAALQQLVAAIACIWTFYPAEYRSTGVMTFIVSRDGIVFQKDLGPKTALRAKTLTQADPDATWKKVE